MRKTYSSILILFIFFHISLSAQLSIHDKDVPPNILLQVNDEGTAGSVELNNVGSFLTGPKLYNMDGNLFWGNSQLDLASGAVVINELLDARYDGNSLFLGNGSGVNDNQNTNANTGVGKFALHQNTSGERNTAMGYEVLYSNTTGDCNTANGYLSLKNNETGSHNAAFGNSALHFNIIGSFNTANGNFALYSNTTGIYNTAIGYGALLSNTSGTHNTANGDVALFFNTTGNQNIAIGENALYNNTTGNTNTANGSFALYNNKTGNNNTAVGYNSGPLGDNTSNTTAIGNEARTFFSNSIRIGNSSVTSIGGYAAWSTISDIRYKNNLKEDVAGIEFIMGLRPVTYNLDVESLSNELSENIFIDKNGNRSQADFTHEKDASQQRKSSKRNTGFVAQEVEELANKLGFEFSGVEVPEKEDGIYRMRYAEFVVPLVKAVQEQQDMIAELRREIVDMKNR